MPSNPQYGLSCYKDNNKIQTKSKSVIFFSLFIEISQHFNFMPYLTLHNKTHAEIQIQYIHAALATHQVLCKTDETLCILPSVEASRTAAADGNTGKEDKLRCFIHSPATP